MLEKMVLATDLSEDWDRIVGCGAELRALGGLAGDTHPCHRHQRPGRGG